MAVEQYRVPDGRMDWRLPIISGTPGVDETESFPRFNDYCQVERRGSEEYTRHQCPHHDAIVFWQMDREWLEARR